MEKKIEEIIYDELGFPKTEVNGKYVINLVDFHKLITKIANRLEAIVKPQGELLLCERNKAIEECATILEEDANRIYELKEKESSILSEMTQDYFDMESEVRKNCAGRLRELIMPTEEERKSEEEATWQN